MFTIIRSIFWLTVAYLIIKPGIELPDTGAIAAQALNAGRQAVVEQVSAIECTSLECIGSRAMATAVLQAEAPFATPALAEVVPTAAPYPRPRPQR